MANNIYISAGLRWKSSPAANTVYVSAGLSPDNDTSAPSGSLSASLSVTSSIEGDYTAPVVYSGDLDSTISISSSIEGGYTAPVVYSGSLNSSIACTASNFSGMYIIGAEMNSTVSVSSNISGSYSLYGEFDSSISVTSNLSGSYSEPGVSEGDLNGNINISCEVTGLFIHNGAIDSSITIIGEGAGIYNPPANGDCIMNISIVGLFGGNYLDAPKFIIDTVEILRGPYTKGTIPYTVTSVTCDGEEATIRSQDGTHVNWTPASIMYDGTHQIIYNYSGGSYSFNMVQKTKISGNKITVILRVI